MLFDLKTLNSVLDELEKERGIDKEKITEAIETALAAAYKKQYGKKGQIIRAKFNWDTGDVEFSQVKIVVDDSLVREPGEEKQSEEDMRPVFNPEHHIKLEDAKLIKKDAELDSEIEFPLEAPNAEFGRIASQTAKQVVMQKLREAEKASVLQEYGGKVGEVVTGEVQRFERGTLYLDLGRAVAAMPYEEQIPGERFRQGARVRALLYFVGDSPKGDFIKVSRTRPEFVAKLFEQEAPEVANGTVEIVKIAREPGSRTKLAVKTNDEAVDPVGALVGQRGVRVSTVTGELGGEKIDIIEHSDDEAEFIANSLSPAEVIGIELDVENRKAIAEVTEDQQSLAIGRGGQNVRLASELTGWDIDIRSASGEMLTQDGVEIEQSEDASAQEGSDTLQEVSEAEQSQEGTQELQETLKEVASQESHEPENSTDAQDSPEIAKEPTQQADKS